MILKYPGRRRVTYGFRLVRQGRLYKRQGFLRRQDAQDAEDAQLAALDPTDQPAADLPWEEAVTRYVAAKASKADLEHDTIRLGWWSRYLAAQRIRTLRQLTADVLDTATGRLAAEGKGPATQVRYLSVLRHLYRLAIRRRWVAGLPNPTEAIDWPRERPVPRRVPTAAEIRRLVRTAEPVVRPLILVGMLTGLRSSSILRLTVEDTRIRPGLLRVVQKGDRELWLPVTLPLARILRRPKAATGPLWYWPDGRALRRFPRKAWRRSLAGAKVSPFGFHQLRHAVGDLLTERRTTQRVLQAFLGHASGRMTERYSRPRDPALTAAQATLAGVLGLRRPIPASVPPRGLTRRPA